MNSYRHLILKLQTRPGVWQRLKNKKCWCIAIVFLDAINVKILGFWTGGTTTKMLKELYFKEGGNGLIIYYYKNGWMGGNQLLMWWCVRTGGFVDYNLKEILF